MLPRLSRRRSAVAVGRREAKGLGPELPTLLHLARGVEGVRARGHRAQAEKDRGPPFIRVQGGRPPPRVARTLMYICLNSSASSARFASCSVSQRHKWGRALQRRPRGDRLS